MLEAFKPTLAHRAHVKACVLVACEGDTKQLSQAIQGMPGVKDAFPVASRREVIVRAHIRSLTHLRELLTEITAVKGVIVSETLLEIPQVVPP